MIELPYDTDEDIRKAAVFVIELKKQGVEFEAAVDRGVMKINLHGY